MERKLVLGRQSVGTAVLAGVEAFVPPSPFDHWSTGTTDPEQLNFPRSLTLGEGVEESSPAPARGELVSRKRFFTVLATGQAAG